MGKKLETKIVDGATASILIKKSEAARMLGFGMRWMDGQLKEGAPCVRVGRSVRLRRSDIEAFARDGRWPGAGLTRKEIDYVLANGGKLPKGMTFEKFMSLGGRKLVKP